MAAGSEGRLTPDGPWALQMEDVHFAYGAANRASKGREVLAGASLSVAPGSVMCLMGVNGCGKSTLIDCILREHEPSAGSILVEGCDVREMDAPELARLVSYVPQVHDRSFAYSVEHVVVMGRLAHLRGLAAPDEEDHALALVALERCGVAHLAQRSYTALSGGEMQMVMLARALAQQAPLMLMDEPTAHLDARNELLFLECVERLVREEGVTVLMATHAPDQAFRLQEAGICVHVALMSEGRVVREGSPDEALDGDALARVFGVEGVIAQIGLPDGGSIRRVVPLRSLPSQAAKAGPAAQERSRI